MAINYSNLTTDEVISLARKLKEIIEKSVNDKSIESVLEELKSTEHFVLENAGNLDRTSELILQQLVGMAHDVTNEISTRMNRNKNLAKELGKHVAELLDSEFLLDEYHCAFTLEAEGGLFYITSYGPDGTPNEYQSFSRVDKVQEIPEESLLKEDPVKWLSKYYLNTDVYEVYDDSKVELSDEEYDEGFDE